MAAVGMLASAAAATTVTPSHTPTPGRVVCAGDCNGDGMVRVAELIAMVRRVLGVSPTTSCGESDLLPQTVDSVVKAVRASLYGCEASSTETFTATPTLTATPTRDDAQPTSTPEPLVNGSCTDCCIDCRTPDCLSECVGVDQCELVADWSGVVTDELSGTPIVDAEVTLNGAAVGTDASGAYSIRSIRDEVCTGLDYLYEFSVRAPGYRTFVEMFYRTPFPSTATRDVTLSPSSEVRAYVFGRDLESDSGS
jgi:hypothetical protein